LAHPALCQAEAIEGLRGGDLVEQVEVNVEEIGFTNGGVDDVIVPHSVEQRSGHAGTQASEEGRIAACPREVARIVAGVSE